MEQRKKKRKYHLYIPWFTNDDVFYDEEEGEDSWVNYLRRNIVHAVGEESPYPYSSWSYARHDSPFEIDEEEEQLLDKKSDTTIHEEVTASLYQHPDLDASNVRAIVLNGIVCLFGTVKTLLEKKEAERIVKTLPGVWNVRNELKIEELKQRSLSDYPVV